MSRMVLDCRFQDHVGDAGPDRPLPIMWAAVDLDFDMHAVVDQQAPRSGRRRVALVAGEFARSISARWRLPLFSLTASCPAMTL